MKYYPLSATEAQKAVQGRGAGLPGSHPAPGPGEITNTRSDSDETGAGSDFWSRYKWPVIIGGSLLIIGIFAAARKRRRK